MNAHHPIYQSFLQQVDLDVWLNCLQEYHRMLSEAWSADNLIDGICVSIYVGWYSHLCGEKDLRLEIMRMEEDFARLIQQRDSRLTDHQREIAMAILAISRGYPKTGEEYFRRAGLVDLPIEWRLLVLPHTAVKKAKLLKSHFTEDMPSAFAPGLYFYAHALLELNYFEEVRALLHQFSHWKTNPLMMDLQAKLFELTGMFSEAAKVYQGSDWATHTYRAFICEMIAAENMEGLDQLSLEGRNEKLAYGMYFFEGEISQAEIARSSAFTNASQWLGYNNWLVNYEMGKLSFRRKRHAEANTYLALAARQAPEPYQYIVQSLRFNNLTWLSHASSTRELELLPETLLAGQEFLQSINEEDVSYGLETRNWLYYSASVKDDALIAPIWEQEDFYFKGEAYEQINELPLAVLNWSKSIQNQYHPRSLGKLIHFFRQIRFDHTLSCLVELGMKESWDDFFVLRELGEALIFMRPDVDGRNFEQKNIHDLIFQLDKRIEALSQTDFQHAIRAYEYFSKLKRSDIAESLLKRAHTLADCPEEYLSVAIGYRKKLGLSTLESKQIAIENLVRAERESTNRLERLQIARELAYFGQIPLARSILTAEGVFKENITFAPHEYILIISCHSPCLSKEELARIKAEALKALEQDFHRGAIHQYHPEFITRLEKFTQLSSTYLEEFVGKEQELDKEVSNWASWKSQLEKAQNNTNLAAEQSILKQKIHNLDEIPLFEKYRIWEVLIYQIEKMMDIIKTLKPSISQLEVPISRDESVALKPRAQIVSHLWRAYFAQKDADEKKQILKKIHLFEESEQYLIRKWNQVRFKQTEYERQRLAVFVHLAQDLLGSIRKEEQEKQFWPAFLPIRQHLVKDIDHLVHQLGDYVQLMNNSFSLKESEHA